MIPRLVIAAAEAIMADFEWTEERKAAARVYAQKSPRSICTCGHQGDGGKSQHEDGEFLGHGKCTVATCGCQQFGWARHTPQFQEFIERARPGVGPTLVTVRDPG